MKNLITLLLTLITLTGYSQTNGCEYEMYSDVWDFDCVERKLKPKNGEKFGKPISDSIYESIDVEKIKSYLLEACIEFRRDYGLVYDVKEDEELTRDAQNHTNKLTYGNMFHSNKKDGKATGEVIAPIPLCILSEYDPSMGDFNKVIAQATFDFFAVSPSHMKILLINNKKIGFGFGIKYEDNTFFVCYQIYDKY